MASLDSDLSQTLDTKIAYILGTFPFLTTTFIDREILEAQRTGMHLSLLAIRRPPPFDMSPDIDNLANQTTYLLPVLWLRFVKANVRFVATRFWTYVSTATYLFTRPQPSIGARLKTLLHFAEGVWAAYLLQHEHIDHIHAHFADRAATVALVASRLLNISYSLTAHANDIYISPILLPEKIQHAVFATTCTKFNKNYLEKLTNRNIELVYHGIDLTKIKILETPPNHSHPPLILSVGQLKEKKGFPHLIKACKILKDQGCEFTCEIIGDGPDYALLAKLITDLNLQDSVVLRGPLSNTEVMARYTQATLFTLPCVLAENADRDGIPNVLLEAMANQVPVVSTNISGIPEIIKDGNTGLLVESGDPVVLAKALANLLNDANLRQQLGLNGRRFVEENFDIRQNIAKLIHLFTNKDKTSTAPKPLQPSLVPSGSYQC